MSESGVPPPNEVTPATPTEPEAPKAKRPKKEKPKSKYEVGSVLKIKTDTDTSVIIPDDETDPHWDPKLRNEVPQALVDGLAEFGWEPSMAAVAVEEGGKLKLVHGKTRWRALAKANAIRKKAGEAPIVAHVYVADEADAERVIYNMRRNVRLNSHVQTIDPMTKAESIVRALSADIDEKQVASDHACTVNEVHGYLLLTDEDKCPPKVQELIRSGHVSFAAALELARRADKLTKAELEQAADQIAKLANGGVKVTAAQVKKAAGVTDGSPATAKQKKELILALQSAKLAGKHGEAAQWAAILALEVAFGTRTVDQFWQAVDRVAKGEKVRVDFKQYAGEDKSPVKGQG